MPHRPGEGHAVDLAVQVVVDAAVGHELVHEQEVAPVLVAPTDEADKVPVAQLADDAHLVGVLLAPLCRAFGHPLDGNLQAELLEVHPVHGAEPALPELPLLGEILRGRRQFGVPDPSRAVGPLWTTTNSSASSSYSPPMMSSTSISPSSNRPALHCLTNHTTPAPTSTRSKAHSPSATRRTREGRHPWCWDARNRRRARR